MKFGIIGAGMIGHFHAKAITAMTGGELHSVFDLRGDGLGNFASSGRVKLGLSAAIGPVTVEDVNRDGLPASGAAGKASRPGRKAAMLQCKNSSRLARPAAMQSAAQKNSRESPQRTNRLYIPATFA